MAKKLTLTQKGTSVPEDNVKDVVEVWVDGNIVMVQMKDEWVRVDLSDDTFAVGAYEG